MDYNAEKSLIKTLVNVKEYTCHIFTQISHVSFMEMNARRRIPVGQI